MSDLISRGAAIATAKDWLTEVFGVKHPEDITLIQRIKDIPVVEPEQKIGRWKYGQDERFVSCSECGMKTTRNELNGIALFGKDEPKFCPSCGAKMCGSEKQEGER